MRERGHSSRHQRYAKPLRWVFRCLFWCRLVLLLGAFGCAMLRGMILTEGAWTLTFSLCCVLVRDAPRGLREHYESAALTAELRARAACTSYRKLDARGAGMRGAVVLVGSVQGETGGAAANLGGHKRLRGAIESCRRFCICAGVSRIPARIAARTKLAQRQGLSGIRYSEMR